MRTAAVFLGVLTPRSVFKQSLQGNVADDAVVTPAYNAKTFDEMIPNSDLHIFDGVGHLAMEEAPERTAAAIDEFLNEILSKASGAAQ